MPRRFGVQLGGYPSAMAGHAIAPRPVWDRTYQREKVRRSQKYESHAWLLPENAAILAPEANPH